MVASHNSYVCKICAEKFEWSKTLEYHMMKKHPPKIVPKFMCEKCEYSAPLKRLLSTHIRRKHTFELHKQCPCCDFKVYSRQKLGIHIDNNHPEYDEKKFTCEFCNRGFIFKLSYSQHKQKCSKSDDNRVRKVLRRWASKKKKEQLQKKDE